MWPISLNPSRAIQVLFETIILLYSSEWYELAAARCRQLGVFYSSEILSSDWMLHPSPHPSYFHKIAHTPIFITLFVVMDIFQFVEWIGMCSGLEKERLASLVIGRCVVTRKDPLDVLYTLISNKIHIFDEKYAASFMFDLLSWQRCEDANVQKAWKAAVYKGKLGKLLAFISFIRMQRTGRLKVFNESSCQYNTCFYLWLLVILWM